MHPPHNVNMPLHKDDIDITIVRNSESSQSDRPCKKEDGIEIVERQWRTRILQLEYLELFYFLRRKGHGKVDSS